MQTFWSHWCFIAFFSFTGTRQQKTRGYVKMPSGFVFKISHSIWPHFLEISAVSQHNNFFPERCRTIPFMHRKWSIIIISKLSWKWITESLEIYRKKHTHIHNYMQIYLRQLFCVIYIYMIYIIYIYIYTAGSWLNSCSVQFISKEMAYILHRTC